MDLLIHIGGGINELATKLHVKYLYTSSKTDLVKKSISGETSIPFLTTKSVGKQLR